MNPSSFSADSQAILLLCSSLGLPRGIGDEIKPLRQDEWNDLARRIADSDLKRPGALLEADPNSLRETLRLSSALTERLQRLLARGGQLAIEVERLSSLGIWVLTRADESYPKRLKQILGSKSPSVLFGAGDQELLTRRGVAVVGSRDVDAAGARFAEDVGRTCAKSGLTIISGAAKGVDRQSMTGALEANGSAVGVLADSLEGAIATRETRQRILEGRLTLVTPFHPRTKFSVRAAMQRNKFIYGLAHYALVVASAQENGGTWAGAIENLKSGWVPLFVRIGTNVPAGNVDLLTRGALEFPHTLLANVQDLQQWFEEHAIGADRGSPMAHDVQEEQKTAIARGAGHIAAPLSSQAPSEIAEPNATMGTCDLFAILWPYIASELSEPRTEREIASHFALEVKQVKAWLTRALGEGLLQKLTRPVRYRLVEPQHTTPEMQASLFDEENIGA